MSRVSNWIYSTSDSRNTKWFPELLFFETVAERAAFFRQVHWIHLKRRGLWIVLLPVGFVLVLLGPLKMIVASYAKGLLSQLPPYASGGLLGGVAGGLSGFLFSLLVRRDLRREMRRELAKRGFRVCLSCGYDLRGQIEPRCPECGAAEKAKT